MTVDATGHVTVVGSPSRFLYDHETGASDPPIDCAYDQCAVGLTRPDNRYEDGYAILATHPVTFLRSPLASPTATVDAGQPLPAVAPTTVHGHGFAPGGNVYVARCSTRATPGGPADACVRYAQTTADASGDLTIGVELRQRSAAWNCLDPSTTCAVRVWGETYASVVTIPIVFDPNSIPPPPPVITVTPAAGLGVAASVAVHGSGFRPDHTAYLRECSNRTDAQPDCLTLSGTFGSGEVSVQTDASGAFDTFVAVQRYIFQIFRPVLDCAQAPGCVVKAIEDSDNPPVPVPITFLPHSSDATISFDGVTVAEGTGPIPTIARARVHLDHASSTPVRFRWFHSPTQTSPP